MHKSQFKIRRPASQAFIPMRFTSLCLLAVLLMAPAAQSADWPCFRGQNFNQIAPDTGINKNWNQRAPKTLWKITLGDNDPLAPVCVASGRLFIVDHDQQEDVVRAIDTATGKELWHFKYAEPITSNYGYTLTTPLVLDGKVYTFSRMGKAHCLNAETGQVVWNRDLAADTKATRPQYFYCSSPITDGQNVIFGPNGEDNASIVALNKDTGKTVWKSGGVTVSYSTPVLATLNGKKQYVIFLTEGLYGLDPATGQQLWHVPWVTKYKSKKSSSPVIIGNRIMVVTDNGGDAGLVDVANDKPTLVWQHKELQGTFETPLYYHGRVYTSIEPKHLACVDPATGKTLWKEPLPLNSSFVGVDDTVIVLSGTTGELIMLDATAPDYKELGRFTPLVGNGKSWVAPIISNGRLFVRNAKELVCLDLK